MADFVNTTTLEIALNGPTLTSPWATITRAEALAALAISHQYRKWTGTAVAAMTSGEMATVDGAIATVVATARESAFAGIFPSAAKGDLPVYNGTTVKRLAASAQLDGEALVIDTADALGVKWARRWNPVMKTSDTTRTATTTLTNDPALTFPVLASHDYLFRGEVFFDTTAAGDFKYAIVGPASPSGVRIRRQATIPGATALAGIAVDTAFGVSVPLAGTGTNGGWFGFYGVLRNGANAGSVTVQWAQNTSDAGNTIVRAGSLLEFVRIT